MLGKAKHLLFFFLIVSLFTSCVSIEKRKYMDGYHVEWYSKNKKIENKEQQRNIFEDSTKVNGDANASFSACNDSSENNIVVKKTSAQIIPSAFLNDTLVKPKNKNTTHYRQPDKKKQMRNFGLLSFFAGFVVFLILVQQSMLYGFVALSAGLLSFIIFMYLSKQFAGTPVETNNNDDYYNSGKNKHDAPNKFDDRKDVTKKEKKLNVFALLGFMFSFFALTLLIFWWPVIFFLSLLLAAIFSIIGVVMSVIHEDKYFGLAFAAVGLALSCLVLFLFLYV